LTTEGWANRGDHNLNVIARLRQGVSVERARVELDGIAHRIRLENPNALTGDGANVALLQERIAAPIWTPLMVLLAAVACVLLIACVNVANLLSARSVARQKEIHEIPQSVDRRRSGSISPHPLLSRTSA
jgi:putative ABC transport system permease protein